jgi:hypothetical protein
MIVGNAQRASGVRLCQTIALFVAICIPGSGCTMIAKDQRPPAPGPGLVVGSQQGPGTARDSEKIVVKDVNGKERRPLAEGGERGTLFFFVLHDCPAANAYAPEMNRIAAKYSAKGVRSYLVYVESDLGEAEAWKHARQHEIGFPALIDRHQELVKVTGATISPEAALVSAEKRVVYHGRIDDRIVAPGKRRVEPTTRDLREALDAMLEGKPVPTPVTKAVGCYLLGNESKQHAP